MKKQVRLGCLLVAVLWSASVWSQTATNVPPQSGVDEVALLRQQVSDLQAALRRATNVVALPAVSVGSAVETMPPEVPSVSPEVEINKSVQPVQSLVPLTSSPQGSKALEGATDPNSPYLFAQAGDAYVAVRKGELNAMVQGMSNQTSLVMSDFTAGPDGVPVKRVRGASRGANQSSINNSGHITNFSFENCKDFVVNNGVTPSGQVEMGDLSSMSGYGGGFGSGTVVPGNRLGSVRAVPNAREKWFLDQIKLNNMRRLVKASAY
ncbi:MAG: hypothetical protein A3H57_03740 [Candidatus Taylorbacteria bacterium RIFCSPLOWO2_02_FULL_43_11]|uniref:Uncharacterized protein n=1 Tax=Candidatus Taylorbacteria bacterium RIFCSPHIGHO2_02_FULL_43_32b TaxID=1802306 RepID=A0A1G2MJN5_9BACT|nr:MAG: hypothetical protein A2743_01230 [Candidatus Taylorbacteria bacterium RIFCSPHIGHO2_01_FULL_43_47]OHA24083.1 MAG: hypothetical protein A3C72_03035 [Candidatus Taylorbacteria bacterium RIFCSPHIGHO2_02_FULL_43_32b]OHA31453.1 MAG: hypothetical protein A3B08_00715 [Candidatus Taylorbacteria bacterium RIFCSPLOWO2_01_FULL_43_44]OHA37505.1 MAG: hypothetical protein A3H57_03740 [Candidatus Taylorbacteria bacterium RIFCSPLOWO2_02_FULL_43_11]